MKRATNNLPGTRFPAPDQVIVIRLPETAYGSLDLSRLRRVRQLLLLEAEGLTQPFLVVDFSAVQLFGASFAGILVSTWDVLRKRDRRLVLCGLTPYCAGLIKNLALDRLFDILPTQQAVLEKFQPGDADENGTSPVPGILIEKSDVAWDPDMERWEYLEDNGRSIQTVIVPRPERRTGRRSDEVRTGQ